MDANRRSDLALGRFNYSFYFEGIVNLKHYSQFSVLKLQRQVRNTKLFQWNKIADTDTI